MRGHYSETAPTVEPRICCERQDPVIHTGPYDRGDRQSIICRTCGTEWTHDEWRPWADFKCAAPHQCGDCDHRFDIHDDGSGLCTATVAGSDQRCLCDEFRWELA